MAGAMAATHTPSMENIETTFEILIFEEINVIAVQYDMSIILHKGGHNTTKHYQ